MNSNIKISHAQLPLRAAGTGARWQSANLSNSVKRHAHDVGERERTAMFFFKKPGPESISEFLVAQKQQQFSYEHVGASRTKAPSGYVVDHNRIQLGEGRIVFDRAKNAIKQWKMFNMRVARIILAGHVPIVEGATVAITVSHLGFWSLNAARIVYTSRNKAQSNGTDSLTVRCPTTLKWAKNASPSSFTPADESVWYDLYAFSRPRALARLALPLHTSLAETICVRFENRDARAVAEPERRTDCVRDDRVVSLPSGGLANDLQTPIHRNRRPPQRRQVHAIQSPHRHAPLDRHQRARHHPRPHLRHRATGKAAAFEVVDTGGIVPEDKAGIPGEILRQARVAIENATRVVQVVDGRAGPMPLDQELAQLLRRAGKPPVIAVNKVDTPQASRGLRRAILRTGRRGFPHLRRARFRRGRAAGRPDRRNSQRRAGAAKRRT